MKKQIHFTSLALFWAIFLLTGSLTAQVKTQTLNPGAAFKAKLADHRNQMRKQSEYEQKALEDISARFQSNPDLNKRIPFKINKEAQERAGAEMSTCEGIIVLKNQDEVNAFGALGCTTITGDLVLADYASSPKITDLTPLSNLTTITGVLQIVAPQLASLAGLNNLNTVGYLNILGCHTITDLNDLSGLTQCNGPVVSTCACSPYHTHISNNSSLVNLNGLSNLSTNNAGLFIQNNPTLQNVDGLSALSFVGDALAFQDNPALEDVNGLSSLTTVHSDLVFRRCHALKNLDGMQNLNSVGAWTVIDDNDMLKNMEGLSGLTSIGGRLWVINNDALKNLEGLSGLTSVGGEIWLENNAVIKNLEGLSSLTSAGGVIVFFNPLIKNLNGISGLTVVGAGGLNFWQNPVLQDVSAISNITTVGGWLVFQDLPALKNIDAASNISWVGGVAGIASCPQVKNVNGFSNITYVGEDSGAFDMASLENVDGFSNVAWVGGFFFLFDNPSLTRCCGIYQLLCADPPSCTTTNIGLGYFIDNNGAGCSDADIIAGGPCAPPVAQPLEDRSQFGDALENNTAFSVYPNPVKDALTIRVAALEAGTAQLRISNSLGEILWEKRLSEVATAVELTVRRNELSTMQAGIYFVTLVKGDETFSRQIVVQE